jgi:hypothetical protein
MRYGSMRRAQGPSSLLDEFLHGIDVLAGEGRELGVVSVLKTITS